MATAEVWSIGRLLQWTTDYLKRHGADSPRLDAEVLLAHALGVARIQLYASFENVPGDGQRTAFRELVRRRAEGEPVAYLVGKREFYSLAFHVTRDVLIPRPETESLVVQLLDLAKAQGDRALHVVDVGTGSGILAVCAAKYLPNARITAIDLSPAALAVARRNAAEHGVADRMAFVESDLLAGLPTTEPVDFVVSNPPYVSEAEYAELPDDVRKFEPRMALVAGPQGTEIIARLTSQAAERLRPDGHLLFEISPMIEEASRAIVAQQPDLELLPTIKDLSRLARVIDARKR